MDIQNLQRSQNQNKIIVDDELLLEHNQNSEKSTYAVAQNQEKDLFMNTSKKVVIGLIVVAVLAGVGTGFGTFRLSHKNLGQEELATLPAAGTLSAGDEFGSKDEAFDSHAIGYIEAGGLEGEGSHKLLRPGGPSQTVYLTSSITDLDTFVGMEVEVWGETLKGQKTGWFMDVGRIKIVNTDGESPLEE